MRTFLILLGIATYLGGFGGAALFMAAAASKSLLSDFYFIAAVGSFFGGILFGTFALALAELLRIKQKI